MPPDVTTWERIHGVQGLFPLVTLAEDPFVEPLSLSSDLHRAIVQAANRRQSWYDFTYENEAPE